jgi:ribosomal protein S6--L-glutamate ligase
MNIGILSCEPKSYSTKRLFDEAQSRGHSVQIINTLRCYMNIGSTELSVHYDGQLLTDIDVVIPRIGASITYYGTSVVRQFEMMRAYALNTSLAIMRSRDKWRTLQILSRHKIPIPQTSYTYDSNNIQELINQVEAYPLIIKLLEGTQGKGVVLAESASAAKSVIDAFNRLKANILLQEYVADADGKDIRCFVIGNKVVASMLRQACEGEFRSNLHCGGEARPIKLTAEEREIAIKATKVMGLNVAGVDVLRTPRGPLVLEVNSSPGLKGIEEASGKNIAEKIMVFIEKQSKKSKRNHES